MSKLALADFNVVSTERQTRRGDYQYRLISDAQGRTMVQRTSMVNVLRPIWTHAVRNEMKIDPPLRECPHCQSDTFCIQLKVSGTIIERHRFDGEPAYNGEMWESALARRQPTVYCNDCGQQIAVVVA